MSFSFRIVGSLRIHGTKTPTDSLYKAVSKFIINHIVSGQEYDKEVLSVLTFSLSKHLLKNSHIIKEGLCEEGNLYSIYSDYDVKGFSSLEIILNSQGNYVKEKKLTGNVISSDREHQIRFVIRCKLFIVPFNLANWDIAIDKGYQSYIPPLPHWYNSIVGLEKLDKACCVTEAEGSSRPYNSEVLESRDPQMTEKKSLVSWLKFKK